MALDSTAGGAKVHAACDECRKRKLKCSGEPVGCTRCTKYSIPCIYSVQKQMGRPKKRQRQDDEAEAGTSSSQKPQSYILDPSLSAADAERNQFENICPGPMGPGAIRQSRNANASLENTPPSDHPRTPSDSDIYNIPYPTDYSIWPDFTETTVPIPLQENTYTTPDKHPVNNTTTLTHRPSNPNPLPDCPCLPNLYLTLSTLSTLSAFPISSHTITTLSSAHRTAHSPERHAVQHPPHRPRRPMAARPQTARDILEKGFSASPPSAHMSALTELEWKTFAYDLVRAHVFGDRTATPPPTPNPAPDAVPPPNSQIIPLMSLADAMERRQNQWHDHEPETGEFGQKLAHDFQMGIHASGFTLEDLRRMEGASALSSVQGRRRSGKEAKRGRAMGV
ncbi:uncharacterized protein AB675_5873 [Cyphellophora attinorum]|uniref:Zn(2)-C6 fungal-type domain-containing protein n=1 Tax=Cyphellophora attinorum TaxID=1664694 RepID=A0A0N0NL98_9EURO|nr:uncharacterized protein AB675_5873 [Phialophora attinorum]KPI38789.1 hypothetical protein AB675_5873 [Phialophora attinorum]